jgi:hypothetical protein
VAKTLSSLEYQKKWLKPKTSKTQLTVHLNTQLINLVRIPKPVIHRPVAKASKSISHVTCRDKISVAPVRSMDRKLKKLYRGYTVLEDRVQRPGGIYPRTMKVMTYLR